MSLSPGVINTVEELMRRDLQAIRDGYFHWLLKSAYLVGIGVIMEGPELSIEIWQLFRKFKLSEKCEKILKVTAFLGWLLIVGGVAGEAIVDGWVSEADTELQAFNTYLLVKAENKSADAEGYAGNAILLAGNASESAKTSMDAAARAESLGHSARVEADTFESDIKAAKQASIDANIKLLAALKRVKDMELEILKIKESRTILPEYRDIMADDLKVFPEPRFDASVGTNSECSDLLKTILGILSRAGWKQVPFNGPINATGFELAVGVSTANGIEISFDKSKESEFWPPAKRLADLLKSIGIEAEAGYTNDKAANTAVIHVIVGTKPTT